MPQTKAEPGAKARWALAHLETLQPPLKETTLNSCRVKLPALGIGLDVLRCLGHAGLASELGISSAVDRARIMCSEGDGQAEWDAQQRPTGSAVKTKVTRVFELRRCSVFEFRGLSSILQSFTAHVYIEFVIRGGALDEDLMADTDQFVFPRPSAKWFWVNQLNWPNSHGELHIKERKVIVEKGSDDLTLIIRADGSFEERLKFHNFPFDSQKLNINLQLMCAEEGPVPVKIVVPADVISGIDLSSFRLDNEWELQPKLELHQTMSTFSLADGTAYKTYPMLRCSMSVRRRSRFYLLKMFIPMLCFSTLALFCCFCVHRIDLSLRFSIVLTLALTANAYMFSAAYMVPAISYLTFLDAYVLACFGLLLSVFLITGFAGSDISGLDEVTLDGFDRWGFRFLTVTWVGVQCYFYNIYYHAAVEDP